MGMGAGGFGNVAQHQINALTSGEAGGDILPAAQRVHQQNLDRALQTQREFGGPRFAMESGRQASDLQQRALNEFNLFTGQLLEGQAQRRQAGVLGAGQLALGQGQLGMAGQQLRAQNIGQAGQLALGQGQQGLDWLNSASQYGQFQGNQQLQQYQLMMQSLMPFLQSLFQAGGASSAPVITQDEGWMRGLINTGASVGGMYAGGR